MDDAHVVLVGVSNSVKKSETEFRDRGFSCRGAMANLANEAELEAAFYKIMDSLDGRLDIIINSAGIQRRNRCEDFTKEDWTDVIQLNLTSVFMLNQLAGRVMLKQGSGKIINIASMLSFFGGFTVPAYAASKGGIAQLTKAFANEWASKGINVNAIAPGYMDTSMNTKLIEDAGRNQEILSRIPAGRWGLPEDMKESPHF